MKTAFELLSLPEDVDDSAVKTAYLKKTKMFSPDKAPEQFQQIRGAYDAIKDKRSRMKYQLFHQQEADFNQLLRRAFDNDQQVEMNSQYFEKLLRFSTIDMLKK